MSYIGTEPKDIRSFGRTKFDYTASQGQTAFTGADDDGKVLAFTTGQINVYVNGILMDDSDFTTTGTGTVTLASAANLNDVVNIVSFESNIPDNDYVPASGGTFTGNITASGTLGVTGAITGTTQTLNRSGDGDLIAFQKGGADSGSISIESSGTTFDGEASHAGLKMFASAVAPRQNGSDVDNTIDLGWTSGRFKDLYLGGSIYGNVTMPNKPRFRAHKTVNVELTSETTIVYNAVTSNVGSHYDTSNGRFTAPVAGLYRFQSMHYHHSTTGGEVRLQLYKNNSLQQNVRHSRSAARSFYDRIVLIEEVELAANDYVYITGQGSSGGQFHTSSGSGYADFYGHLIG